jgi:hypothetical protein
MIRRWFKLTVKLTFSLLVVFVVLWQPILIILPIFFFALLFILFMATSMILSIVSFIRGDCVSWSVDQDEIRKIGSIPKRYVDWLVR